MQLKNEMGPHRQKITMKLSGDDTQFSVTTSMSFLTLSFPYLSSNVLSASGIQSKIPCIYIIHVHVHPKHTVHHTQHTWIHILLHVGYYTYAAVKGHETHKLLRNSISHVWRQVADLINDPVVSVDGWDYTLEVACGADYKVHAQHAKYYYHYYFATAPSACDGDVQCNILVLMHLVHCQQGGKVYTCTIVACKVHICITFDNIPN